jgi:glucose-6-phosphate isomerase
VKENFVDGKYATIENIARAEILENTQLQYDIADNWVYNHDAAISTIKVEYQKFHMGPDFTVNASEESIDEVSSEKKLL